MPSSCCVKGCPNKQNYDGYSLFGFPNDSQLKKLWLEAVALDSLKSHHRVCEVHFKPELIQFVGSRKELDKSAVPSLFCNCNYAKVIDLIGVSRAAKSASKSHKRSLALGATTLEHSYCSSPVLVKTLKKESDDNQNSELNTVSKKAVKHSPVCNITREPLKKAPTSLQNRTTSGTFSGMFPPNNSTKAAPSLLRGLLNNNVSTLKSPPNSVPVGSLYKVIPINFCAKAPSQLLSGPSTTRFKKIKPDQCKLRVQLQTALDENAKLKKELSLLKERSAAATWHVPVTM